MRLFIELKKKKPRKNLHKVYNMITDLDEYPRINEDDWDIKEEKSPRRG